MGDTFSAVFIVILILTELRRPTIKLVFKSFLFELQMLSSYHPSLVKLLSNIFLISPYLFNTSTRSNDDDILRADDDENTPTKCIFIIIIIISSKVVGIFIRETQFLLLRVLFFCRQKVFPVGKIIVKMFTQSPRLSTRLGGPRRIERPQNRHILNTGKKRR